MVPIFGISTLFKVEESLSQILNSFFMNGSCNERISKLVWLIVLADSFVYEAQLVFVPPLRVLFLPLLLASGLKPELNVL